MTARKKTKLYTLEIAFNIKACPQNVPSYFKGIEIPSASFPPHI